MSARPAAPRPSAHAGLQSVQRLALAALLVGLQEGARGLEQGVGSGLLDVHDLHVNRPKELISVLDDAGVSVLERSWKVIDFDGCSSAWRG